MGDPVTGEWVSRDGIRIRDLVPRQLRRAWVRAGHCPDRDLYSLFAGHVREHPHRPAVIDAEGSLGYSALDALVRRNAATLADAGFGADDIIGIALPNGRDAVAAELAVAAIGAVALPYPQRGSAETLSLLGRARAGGLICASRPAESVLAGLGALRAVFTPETLRSAKDDPQWTPQPAHPEAPARILVSSGSEAEPKMVAYSHNAMAGGRAAYLRALHTGDEPMRNLVLVSLASSFGSCGTPVSVAALGATLLLTSGFDPERALRTITRYRPTHVFGVPTMLRRMADAPRSAGEDTSSLLAVVSSGAALPRATAEACDRRFGRPVITVYGSADGVNCHTAGIAADGSAGTGAPDPAVADIEVTDERGRPVPVGFPGEVSAFGPMTPLCYVAAPELDARYRSDGGWVRTGDLGRFDAQGRLHLLGRSKQIVIRGGYNISPAEVERELGGHPALADVACVALPDPDLGERMCACVCLTPGAATITLPEITGYLERERGLDRRKLPEALVVLPEFPLGPTGKPCRRTLAAIAADRTGKPSAEHVR
jgi:acyl-CoA synthetase (AMP-forming)/AMP-acid ligase II